MVIRGEGGRVWGCCYDFALGNMRHLTPDIVCRGKNWHDEAPCHPSGQTNQLQHSDDMSAGCTASLNPRHFNVSHSNIRYRVHHSMLSIHKHQVCCQDPTCPSFRFLPRDRFTPSLDWVARTVTSSDKNCELASINKWVKSEPGPGPGNGEKQTSPFQQNLPIRKYLLHCQ